VKAEKNATSRSTGSKHLQQNANSQQSHGLGIQNAASDGHSQSNDSNTVNDSLAPPQKLRRGRKPLQASGVQHSSGSSIGMDSTNMPQAPHDSYNTMSDTSLSLKEKGTKKRKADKGTVAKGSSEENSFEVGEEPNSASLEKVSERRRDSNQQAQEIRETEKEN